MTIKTKFFLLLMSCLYLTACQSDASTDETKTNGTTYERLANTDFKEVMAKFPNAQLVDVRTPNEYKSGHIGHAQNIDYNGADFKHQIATLDKSKPVLVYCQAGGRSKKACTIMQDLGFKEVYELKHGYGSWGK